MPGVQQNIFIFGHKLTFSKNNKYRTILNLHLFSYMKNLLT